MRASCKNGDSIYRKFVSGNIGSEEEEKANEVSRKKWEKQLSWWGMFFSCGKDLNISKIQ